MLKDKGTVRLRTVLLNGGMDSSERLVLLENLAWTIRDLSPSACAGNNDMLVHHHHEQIGISGQAHHQNSSYRDGGGGSSSSNNNNRSSSSIETSIECIYIQNDQFFDCERPVSKADKTQSKTVIKTIRGITQRAESFVQSMVDPGDGAANDLPVFVVTDVSFWCLRDFGSHLMRTTVAGTTETRADYYQCSSSSKAYMETIESYPKYKRSLKTLGAAIDSYMKRNGFWRGGPGGGGDKNQHHHHQYQEVIFLLYSKPDDRFDMITLQS